MPLHKFALRIQTQKFIGHVAHRALRFGLRLLPTDAAEFIQRRLMAFGAGVSLHQIEPLDRNVKLGVFRVIQQHELAAFGRRDRCR
jgi:hypothetical protein